MAGKLMVCLQDFEDYARDTLAKDTFAYFGTGAANEETRRDNTQAYKRYRLVPRVLRDVANRDLSTTILGHNVAFPVGISPSAMQRCVHPDGEVATAKAAAARNIIFTHSTAATASIEEVTAESPNSIKFFQMYIPLGDKERNITRNLIRRAEQHNYRAIVLTVDMAETGIRYSYRKKPMKLPSHLKISNLEKAFMDIGETSTVDFANLNRVKLDSSLTWNDVKWLIETTTLPVVIKGVLSAADAALAVGCGVAAIWVSNHGGRQLDSVPATIDVLPSVVKAVAGRCEVYIDGGVRLGTDVLKALALGATAVFIGTSPIYGLTYDGENGVKQVLDILKEEFSTAMALSGCSKVEDITSDLVIHESQYLHKL